MTEKVVVIGAGMAGLCTALSLASDGREILLLEQDVPPPDGGVDEAFFGWSRRGVGQLRHSHAFLARLRTIIKRRHPALLDELLAAGCREIGLVDMLPDALREDYAPEDGDSEMVVLTSRRTTLEWVIRRYVERLDQVAVLSGVTVRTLIIDRLGGGQLRVAGVAGDQGGSAAEWRGGVIIDASGRNSRTADQLTEAGAIIREQAEDCGIVYYTRHYRTLPAVGEPPRGQGAATGDLGFIKFGLFPGDNGCFSITLAVPDIEMEMRRNIVDPAVFDRVCAMLPGIAPWTDPARAEPISKVFGMGDLRSRWRRFVVDDQRATLGFFAVGDSLVRTNPLYGRGCSFAAVQAEILGAVLAQTADPAVRARLYDTRVREELTVYYENMRDQDRAAMRRARNALDPDYRPSLRSMVRKSFINDGVRIAVRSEVDLLRAALRDFHMLEPPGQWLKRPAAAAKVVKWWARGKQRNSAHYPPAAGPGRADMMTGLGLDGEADIQRLKAEAA